MSNTNAIEVLMSKIDINVIKAAQNYAATTGEILNKGYIERDVEIETDEETIKIKQTLLPVGETIQWYWRYGKQTENVFDTIKHIIFKKGSNVSFFEANDYGEKLYVSSGCAWEPDMIFRVIFGSSIQGHEDYIIFKFEGYR